MDNIGRITVELKDYRERRRGNVILEEIRQKTANMPGIHVEVREPHSGPPTGKDVMIDVNSDNYADAVADDRRDPRAIWTACLSCATSRTRVRCPASNGT